MVEGDATKLDVEGVEVVEHPAAVIPAEHEQLATDVRGRVILNGR